MAEAELRQAARAIAERIGPRATVVADTGAGMSRESGVPTFRGAEGLWEKHRAEDVATIEVLRAAPGTFWRFHDSLRQVMMDAEPNAGHRSLADMEQALGDEVEFGVITQNIDCLHQRAGSRHVVQVHGDALSYECMACGANVADVPYPAPSYPPTCETCGGVIRPRVVLFGEMLPEQALLEAQRLAQAADVFLVIGTSVVVEPAASLPFIALQSGALVVEINPIQTPLTPYAHCSVRGGAATAIPALWAEVRGALGQ